MCIDSSTLLLFGLQRKKKYLAAQELDQTNEELRVFFRPASAATPPPTFNQALGLGGSSTAPSSTQAVIPHLHTLGMSRNRLFVDGITCFI
jgi:hypothetical protein